MSTTFQEASTALLTSMSDAKTNTVRSYKSLAVKANAALGTVELAQFKNRHLRDFVVRLQTEGAAPSTIQAYLTYAKLVVAFPVDDEGEQLFGKKWNSKFIQAPRIKPRDQRTPVATKEDIERVLSCGDESVARFISLASATGMRVSEILGPDTTYNSELSTIQIHRGKTDSSERVIYLMPEFNEWLRAHGGPPVRLSLDALRNRLRKYGLPPAHSYRRFRITHLRKSGMNESILRRQVGHADPGITSRYDRSGSDEAFARAEVDRVGLGFKLS